MKTTIKPGMILDHLAPEEFLKAHEGQNDMILKLLGKNAIFRRVNYSFRTDGTVGSQVYKQMGPPDGFMWDVRGVNWASPANGALNAIFAINEPVALNSIALVQNATTSLQTTFISAKSVVLHSGDYLSWSSSAALVADVIGIQLLVIEVPTAHEAQLLL